MDAPDVTLRYDDRPGAIVDVHLPTAAIGSVLLVHGGFWKQRYDRTHLYPMARALAELGYVTATPEYRRVGGGGGWPTTWQDVEDVATVLPGLCTEAGIPWDSPVAVGHSAGGHLALLLAAAAVPLAGVVGLGAVCDLRAALELDLGTGAAAAFLAGAEPDEADPMSRPARSGLRVELVHGSHDDEVPVSLAHTYSAHHPGTVLTELDCGHYELITPGSIAWSAVVRAVENTARSR